MTDIDITCRGCRFAIYRDNPDRTTRQVCGYYGISTVRARMKLEDAGVAKINPAKWCGPEAKLRVERK